MNFRITNIKDDSSSFSRKGSTFTYQLSSVEWSSFQDFLTNKKIIILLCYRKLENVKWAHIIRFLQK